MAPLFPSAQALAHGGEALLGQGLDRRALMMVLAVGAPQALAGYEGPAAQSRPWP